MTLLDTLASIETPERVAFRYELAGPGRRSVAWAIDAAIRAAAISGAVLAAVLVSASSPRALGDASVGLLLVALFVLEWCYGIAFEYALQGRTPGKIVVGVRVVRVDGSPASLADLVLRNLLRAVDYLPMWPLAAELPMLMLPTFGVGAAVALFDPRLRRVGDLVAGTIVVVESARRLAASVPIEPPLTDAERGALPPRIDLSSEELKAIEALLRRRRTLSAGRAEEIASLLGPTLAARTGISAPSALRTLTLAYARATQRVS